MLEKVVSGGDRPEEDKEWNGLQLEVQFSEKKLLLEPSEPY